MSNVKRILTVLGLVGVLSLLIVGAACVESDGSSDLPSATSERQQRPDDAGQNMPVSPGYRGLGSSDGTGDEGQDASESRDNSNSGAIKSPGGSGDMGDDDSDGAAQGSPDDDTDSEAGSADGGQTDGSDGPSISLSLGGGSVRAGDNVTVEVALNGEIHDRYNGYNIHLTFDSNVVEFVSYEEMLFKPDGFCQSLPENDLGQVTIACVLLGKSTDETGKLGELTLKALTPGDADLDLQALQLGEETDTASIGDRTFLTLPPNESLEASGLRVGVRSAKLIVQ